MLQVRACAPLLVRVVADVLQGPEREHQPVLRKAEFVPVLEGSVPRGLAGSTGSLDQGGGHGQEQGPASGPCAVCGRCVDQDRSVAPTVLVPRSSSSSQRSSGVRRSGSRVHCGANASCMGRPYRRAIPPGGGTSQTGGPVPVTVRWGCPVRGRGWSWPSSRRRSRVRSVRERSGCPVSSGPVGRRPRGCGRR